MKKPVAHTLKSVLPWIDLPSSISGKAKEEEKEAQPLSNIINYGLRETDLMGTSSFYFSDLFFPHLCLHYAE